MQALTSRARRSQSWFGAPGRGGRSGLRASQNWKASDLHLAIGPESGLYPSERLRGSKCAGRSKLRGAFAACRPSAMPYGARGSRQPAGWGRRCPRQSPAGDPGDHTAEDKGRHRHIRRRSARQRSERRIHRRGDPGCQRQCAGDRHSKAYRGSPTAAATARHRWKRRPDGQFQLGMRVTSYGRVQTR